MSVPPGNLRLSIKWSDRAKNQLRAIDQSTALDILHCVDRYLATREGDVKKLSPPLQDFRLRCGDYRIFFESMGDEGIEVSAVRHRREAYR
jgi:mRNA-degrading endonuclease RelE of RelBE toxin-antitoxin system